MTTTCNADGFDLTQAEEHFGIPQIPVRPGRLESGTLAKFCSPDCNCGGEYGITYDLPQMCLAHMLGSEDPNEIMLHELTHAWQHHRDPHNRTAERRMEILFYDYENQPSEVEARKVAAELNAAGVQVWFPDEMENPEGLAKAMVGVALETLEDLR